MARRHRALYYGWIVLGVCTLLNFVFYGGRFSFGVFFKPMAQDLGWSRTLTAGAFGLNLLLSGVFAPFLGWLMDRFGARAAINVGALVGAVITGLIAWTQSAWYFYLVFGVLQPLLLAGASINICSALAARWFVRLRATALAIISSGASLGQLALAPLLGYLVVQTGWRASIMVLAAIMIATALPGFFLLREHPADLGLRPDGAAAGDSPAHPGAAASPAPAAAARSVAPGLGLAAVLRSAAFWQLSAGFFVCGWSVGVALTHLPAFTTDVGYSTEMAGLLLAIIGGMNVLSTLLYGGLCDRSGKKSLPLASVYFIRGIALLFLFASSAAWALYVFAVLAGISWLATVPMTYGLAGDHFGLRNIATIIGIVFFSHQVGAAVSSWLAGWWFDQYQSYAAMWLLAALLCFAASAVSAIVKEGSAIRAPLPAEQPATP
ncbi:MAG: MFS transporter [Candidatus Tectomicrobia bacterium]|nr:MFS transporter [Candidatus Tectomicrobia bacterium]